MNTPRFLQIHWLASYPGTLLNRDDAGLAKRLSFGGSTRARISSQCLKRHWRLAGTDSLEDAKANPWAMQNLDVPMGVRTKEVVEKKIMPPARERAGEVSDEIVGSVQNALLKELYGDKATDLKSRQALFFGEPEIDYLVGVAAEAFASDEALLAADSDKEKQKEGEKALKKRFRAMRANLRELKNGAGLGAALFGRMVTSDPASNTDAAIHVAHALTVHPIERELDFMTAVDDLKSREDGDDSGAAGMFDMELTSGLYYGYTVIDIPLLVSNLGGEREIAAKVVEHLIHLIAQVSPGAKKGSTAPYAWAETMLIEAGNRQPRTLANAFRDPIGLKTNRLQGVTVERMGAHLAQFDTAYGNDDARRQLAVNPEEKLAAIETVGLDGLADWAAQAVRSGAGR